MIDEISLSARAISSFSSSPFWLKIGRLREQRWERCMCTIEMRRQGAEYRQASRVMGVVGAELVDIFIHSNVVLIFLFKFLVLEEMRRTRDLYERALYIL